MTRFRQKFAKHPRAQARACRCDIAECVESEG
jgi:hypothetical protein